jgi:ferredoxin-NADP reductase
MTAQPDEVFSSATGAATLRLVEKEHLVDNIWAFRFEPSVRLEWTAGQYVSLEVPHAHPDGEGTKRWFTVSSAPYEGIVQVTTRVTASSFKAALSKLSVGGCVLLLDRPHGDFVWEDCARPIVFVAGGIGVTPFRSILKQRAHDGRPLDVTLIYGSRTPDVPFKDELEGWVETDTGLHVLYVPGRPLTARLLCELVPALDESLVYLSGPRVVMEALCWELAAQGLPEAWIKEDFFPAYSTSNY